MVQSSQYTDGQSTLNKYKTKPYKHQGECLRLHGGKPAYALLAEMGTGKTWIIINDIADLWARGLCMTVLVIAPNGVHSNWTRLELPKHMPDWVRYKAVTWYANPNKTEKQELKDMHVSESGELLILTMNKEIGRASCRERV